MRESLWNCPEEKKKACSIEQALIMTYAIWLNLTVNWDFL